MKTIISQKRDPAAKAKQLRRAGIVPCVIYGTGLAESVSVQIDHSTARQLRRSMRSGSKINIKVGEISYPTLIKDIVYSSLNDEVIHISFHVLDSGKKYNSVADIVLLNKEKVGGVLEQLQTRVPHAAEPEYLLDTVTIDLENLPIGTALTIGDIPEFQSDKIELQVDPGNIILRINDKKRSQAQTA